MGERTAITLRLPHDLLEQIRAISTAEGGSVNDFLVRAAERHVFVVEYEEAKRLRAEHRQRIRERLGGPLPDSTPLIRQLREGGPEPPQG